MDNIKVLSNEESMRMGSVFAIFSDPMRLNIIYVLIQKEMCVSDLAKVLRSTQSNISHHLAVLKNNDLVSCRKEGKQVLYSLKDEHVKMLFETGFEHVDEKFK